MAREANRRTRTPVADSLRSRMGVKGKDPNYEYRWVNDTPGRIDSYKEAEWEVVTDDNIVVGERRINAPSQQGTPKTVAAGQGITAVLMKIKKEYYDEDQAAKHAKVHQLTQNKLDEAKNSGDYGTIKYNEK